VSSGQRNTWVPTPPARQGGRAVHSKTGIGLALFLTATLSSCATTNSNPYPYFERLAIRSEQPAPTEATTAVASTGELMAAGAAAGASGALATGLLASLVCGPYFAVCFAGTGVAALGGATVGAVLGGSTALSAEDTETVIGQLENLQRAHNLGADLTEAVSARLPAERLAVADTADAHLGLEVQGLRVASGFADSISIGVPVKASLEWQLDRAVPRETSRSFVCWTEPSPLEGWLDSDNNVAAQGLSLCIDDLALQIWTALQAPDVNAETDSHSLVGFGNYDPAVAEW
jgi:hypothetical protein